MLGKLLKYDFRSMFKQFAFIWPAALALGLINRFTLNSQMREDGSVWIQDSAGVLASSAAMAASRFSMTATRPSRLEKTF